MPDLVTALPEIILLAAACVVLLAEAFAAPGQRGLSYVLAQASLTATALSVAVGFPGEEVRAFSGMYVTDALAGVPEGGLDVVAAAEAADEAERDGEAERRRGQVPRSHMKTRMRSRVLAPIQSGPRSTGPSRCRPLP